MLNKKKIPCDVIHNKMMIFNGEGGGGGEKEK